MITGEHLAAYAAGDADPELAARIDAALAEDEQLRARLAAIRELDVLLAELPPVELPNDVATRITGGAMAAARDHLDEGARAPATVVDLDARRRRLRWVGAAAAAVAVVAIGGPVLVGQLGAGGDDSAADEAATTESLAGDAGQDRDEAAAGMAEAPGTADDGEQGADEEAETLVAAPEVVDAGLVLASLEDVAAEMPEEAPAADEGGGDADELAPDERGDGRVSPAERELALACTPVVDGEVERATLARVAADGEVVVYETGTTPRRYVVVDPADCTVLADLER